MEKTIGSIASSYEFKYVIACGSPSITFELKDGGDWASISTSTTSVTLTVTENTTTMDRVCIIVPKIGGSECEGYTITQKNKGSCSISSDSGSSISCNGGTVTFTINKS